MWVPGDQVMDINTDPSCGWAMGLGMALDSSLNPNVTMAPVGSAGLSDGQGINDRVAQIPDICTAFDGNRSHGHHHRPWLQQDH